MLDVLYEECVYCGRCGGLFYPSKGCPICDLGEMDEWREECHMVFGAEWEESCDSDGRPVWTLPAETRLSMHEQNRRIRES